IMAVGVADPFALPGTLDIVGGNRTRDRFPPLMVEIAAAIFQEGEDAKQNQRGNNFRQRSEMPHEGSNRETHQWDGIEYRSCMEFKIPKLGFCAASRLPISPRSQKSAARLADNNHHRFRGPA